MLLHHPLPSKHRLPPGTPAGVQAWAQEGGETLTASGETLLGLRSPQACVQPSVGHFSPGRPETQGPGPGVWPQRLGWCPDRTRHTGSTEQRHRWFRRYVLGLPATDGRSWCLFTQETDRGFQKTVLTKPHPYFTSRFTNRRHTHITVTLRPYHCRHF